MSSPDFPLQLDYTANVTGFANPNQVAGTTALKSGTFTLTCYPQQAFCTEKLIVFPTIFGAANYQVSVTFEAPSATQNSLNNIYFVLETATDAYVTALIAVRYALLAVSLLAGISYVVFFLKTNRIARTFEHKMILILSISLIFFNDPFSFFSTTSQNPCWWALAGVAIGQFFGLLVFLWLGLLHKIRHEPDMNGGLTKTNPLLVVVGGFFVLSLSVLVSVYAILSTGQTKLTPRQ